MSNEHKKAKSDILTRRKFLRSSVRAGLAGLAAPALAGGWLGSAHGASDRGRAYSQGLYGLELDGVFMGFASAVSGGDVFGEVVVEKPGPDRIQRKHVAGLKVEPISLDLSLPMAKPFYAWLKSTFEPGAKPMAKSGALLTLDYDRKVIARREFANALITEVEFPVCDAASKDASTLGVTFLPERIATVATPVPGAAISHAAAARWLAAHFRLNIQGLEAATVRASRVEAFTVKSQVSLDPVGERRDYAPQRVSLEIPNLVVTISEAHARPFYDWHSEFVIRGNNGQDRERVGVLEYLAPDLKSVLLAVNFFNLGIFRAAPEPAVVHAENIRRMKASMYCEAISVDFKV